MLEVLRKIGQFVDKSKQPKRIGLGQDVLQYIAETQLRFSRFVAWRSLFLGMMHFQDKYNEDLRAFAEMRHPLFDTGS